MEEPINAVVVVGAGASRDLGTSPLPLMDEWANTFHASLEADDSTNGIARLIGLPSDGDGFAFESAVGNYLRHLSSLEGMEQYVRVGNVRVPNRDTHVVQWLRDSKQHGEAFKLALWRSVWDTFGPARVDARKAATAYGMLLGLLQASAGAVVFATTNYDHAIEKALNTLDQAWSDGFSRDRYEPQMSVTGLVDWPTRNKFEIPVLHLHGAVGWYQRKDGSVINVTNVGDFRPELGTPAMAAPDPEKAPESDPTLSPIWSEFIRALAGATHVVVIGHSLADRSLLNALKTETPSSVTPILIRPENGLEGFLHIAARFGPKADPKIWTDYLDWPGQPPPTRPGRKT